MTNADTELELELALRTVTLGSNGIASRVSPDDDEPFDGEAERRFELFGEREMGDSALGTAPLGIAGVAYALVDNGRMRVTDSEGHDAVRPIRLPANVARSECSNLDFISDVDLALHGSAPCIPTRINFRTGRTTALGRAYVEVARTPDRRRVLLLANRQVTLVDGSSGANLVTLDPEVPHPRSVRLSADGKRGVVTGTDGFAVLDFSAVAAAGTTPATAVRHVYTAAPWPAGYDVEADKVYGCEGRAMRVAPPFAMEAAQTVAFGPCSEIDPDDAYLIAWRSIPGFLIQWTAHRVGVLRVRDGATLDFEWYASVDDVAIVLRDSTGIVGVYPDDSPIVAFRDGANGELRVTEPSASRVESTIRAFFASP